MTGQAGQIMWTISNIMRQQLDFCQAKILEIHNSKYYLPLRYFSACLQHLEDVGVQSLIIKSLGRRPNFDMNNMANTISNIFDRNQPRRQ